MWLSGEEVTRLSAKQLYVGSSPTWASPLFAINYLQFLMKERKYLLNKIFFDNWSPEMAYVLGFWFADGYMRHEKSYRIVFNSRDYNLLLQIKKCFSCNYFIKRYQRRDGIDYQLILYSKHLYQELLTLGGMRCKSKKMRFPKVPKQCLADFIRGYFDGDGSVFYTTYIHTKTKRPRTELRSNFTSGNPKFLEDLQNILVNTLGFIKKKIGSYNNGASRKLGYGTKNTLELLRFMYYNGYSIGLERKAAFLKNKV